MTFSVLKRHINVIYMKNIQNYFTILWTFICLPIKIITAV